MMHKKYVYVCCISLLVCTIAVGSENQEAAPSENEYEPGLFTEQLKFGFEKMRESSLLLSEKVSDFYYRYVGQGVTQDVDQDIVENAGQNILIQEAVQEVVEQQNVMPVPNMLAPKQYLASFDIKKYIPEMNLTKNQKYVIATTITCAVLVGIAYKYGLFSSKKKIDITAKNIQKLVESVLHNQAIPKQDKLNHIFKLLMKKGLSNMVIHNDHVFEVNNQFKVEIKGKTVKVTHS